MLFFYGTGTSNLGSFPLRGVQCVNCGHSDTVWLVLSSRYAHFFWVPLFPIGKRSVTVCNFCKQALSQGQWPPAYQQAAFPVVQQARTPLTNYIGLLLLAIPVAFVLLGGVFALFGVGGTKPVAAPAATTAALAATTPAADSAGKTYEADPASNEAKLADPQVGDLYVVYNTGGHVYTVMRVERVEADKLYFKASLYQPQHPATVSPDSVANRLQGGEIPIPREGLAHMNEAKILTVVRP